MTEEEKLNIAQGYEKDFNDTNYVNSQLRGENALSRLQRRRLMRKLRNKAQDGELTAENESFLNGLDITGDQLAKASRRQTREFINDMANPLNNNLTNLLNQRKERLETLQNDDAQPQTTINEFDLKLPTPQWSPGNPSGSYQNHLVDMGSKLLQQGQTQPRWQPDNLTEQQGNNLRSFVQHVGNLGENATNEQYQQVYNTFQGFDKDQNGGFQFNDDGSVYYKDNAGRDVYFQNGQLQAKSGNSWTPIQARAGESGYLSQWSPVSNANASTVTTASSPQQAAAQNTQNTTPVQEDKEQSWLERFMSFIPSYSYH